MDIVYRHIEFVTWILSIITSLYIVYCHIVIVYRHINVVTCSSLHSAIFRATVFCSQLATRIIFILEISLAKLWLALIDKQDACEQLHSYV